MAGPRSSSTRRKAPRLVSVPAPDELAETPRADPRRPGQTAPAGPRRQQNRRGDTDRSEDRHADTDREANRRGAKGRADRHADTDQAAARRGDKGRADRHADTDQAAARRVVTDRVDVADHVDPRLGPPASALDDPRLSDVDEWGRSQHLREILGRLYEPIYEHWFRVEWEGFDKLPRSGGALIVANHAGAIPADAPSIMHGIERDLGRPVYGLADEVFKRMPVVNVAWSRLGGVQAHPDNAYRLLREQQQLVTVFPEGSKGPGKTYRERYQLRRFGRGGFVQIAMRAGVPIIPMAVIGSEETMPILFKATGLAKALGIPYFPVTANMLVLGPLGAFLPFPAKLRIRVLDPVKLDVLPDQPRYSRSRIMDTSEAIRQSIQEELYEMLRQRRSIWTG